MDMIGSIHFIESKLGKYSSRQNNGKLTPKLNSGKHTDYQKVDDTENSEPFSEHSTQVGRNIDTTA